MLAITRNPVPVVVQQHVEDVASLRVMRSVLVRAPHVSLSLLRRLDDRLAASLDGIDVAGDPAVTMCIAALATPGRGTVFAATVCAIERRDSVLLDRLLALAEAVPEGRHGLVSACGWVSAASLRGISAALLRSPSIFRRSLALEVCVMHQVDPADALETALRDPQAQAHAATAAGRMGRTDLLPQCMLLVEHDDDQVRFAAAHACALLGDRRGATKALGQLAQGTDPVRTRSGLLLLKLVGAEHSRAWLRAMADDPAAIRFLVRAAGVSGDPQYMPWLITRMGEARLSRIAGEAFSMTTGVDLAKSGLEVPPPQSVDTGPNDDPGDDDIALDEDDGLPWPDPDKIAAWWQSNSHRFTPGTRYFMGQPPSPTHCLSVLKDGFQRQRIAAAEYLTLMSPGTPLFNCAAPAWRQQRWLAAMGA